MITERRILLDFLGVAAVCGAGISLSSLFFTPPLEWAGYLGGVLDRSLTSPFQAVLLAGVAAVPLHVLWVLIRYGGDAAASYDSFASWVQPLFTSFGFMGTIVGVSLAVAGLQAAMDEGEPGALITGLSTAFDTTFLGLLGAVGLMLIRRAIKLSRRPAA